VSELPSLDVAALPLVLAGPIVRRVDQDSATVWLALKAPRKVTLDVYEGATEAVPTVPTLTGTRVTARLGEHLYVVAVTARTPSGGTLRPGTIHRYALRFGADVTSPAMPVPAGAPGLFSPGIVAADEAKARSALLYQSTSGAPALPSFVTPPDHPAKLRLFHASCRKPHAGGHDALSILDEVLTTDAGSPERRPQQLILTGDQIYADDVADGLLHICTAYGRALLGRDETFPTVPPAAQKWQLRPGWRQDMIEKDFHLTTTHGRSHLLRLSEFLAMYLLAWSPALWPAVPPIRFFTELFPKEAAALGDPDPTEFFGLRTKPEYKKAHERLMEYVAECDRLDGFRGTLGMVRRALANTATYMMFDDHEVTDDWYISKRWVREVCDTVHGRQFLGNAMASYAVCQGWGNTPEQFADGPAGEPGRELLTALAAPDHTAAGPAEVIARRTGVPGGVDSAGRITRAGGSLAWHYAITWPAHQLVAVDTRTQRVFRGGPTDPPSLIFSDASFTTMLEAPADQGLEKVTVLLSPCPVLGDPVIEEFAQPAVRRLQGYPGQLDQDVEAWAHDPRAFEKFIARVLGHAAPGADGVRRRRVISLGGDVHYGFAARMAYRATTPYSSPAGHVRGVLAQLTASSLKNQATGTMVLHHAGFNPVRRPHTRRAGWANTDGKTLFVRTDGPLGIPADLLALHESPAVLELPDGNTVRSPAPEWEYELTYVRHTDPDGTAPRPGGPVPVSFPATGDRRAALAQYVQAAENHLDYMAVTGSGREIVGRNNIGEVQFTWDGQDAKSVTQTLWWHLPGNTGAAPLTRLVVPLDVGQTTGPPPAALPDLYGGRNPARGRHRRLHRRHPRQRPPTRPARTGLRPGGRPRRHFRPRCALGGEGVAVVRQDGPRRHGGHRRGTPRPAGHRRRHHPHPDRARHRHPARPAVPGPCRPRERHRHRRLRHHMDGHPCRRRHRRRRPPGGRRGHRAARPPLGVRPGERRGARAAAVRRTGQRRRRHRHPAGHRPLEGPRPALSRRHRGVAAGHRRRPADHPGHPGRGHPPRPARRQRLALGRDHQQRRHLPPDVRPGLLRPLDPPRRPPGRRLGDRAQDPHRPARPVRRPARRSR
jgi:hypothetical protein